jgi:hypothetical protein
VFALHHAHEALEAHAGVDDVHGQFLERTVGLAVELHEHEVPYFDDLWVVFVDQVASGFWLLLGRAQSMCISEQGPQGPVSPISQKLSCLLPLMIWSTGTCLAQ